MIKEKQEHTTKPITPGQRRKLKRLRDKLKESNRQRMQHILPPDVEIR